MTTIIEITHSSVREGREVLKSFLSDPIAIPSFRPTMEDNRWRAEFIERFLSADSSQQQVLQEIMRIVSTLTDITTQRAIYYTLRGTHPDWTYKGKKLDDDFYQQHLVSWVMEKLQLHMGMTMQSVGVWAAPRGYISGDGDIVSSRRGRIPLQGRPTLGFDLADEGARLDTHARKVIHFEKDAGFESLTAGNMPKYLEAVFSTSQGQLSEAAQKFLRQSEDAGMSLYAVHDGDPSGIQMQLLYGLASKNNCYMPSEFYPRTVVPLGFYPSVGDALGLPPEEVGPKEGAIFRNLYDMVEGKEKGIVSLEEDIETIVRERKKWEFQALNALHEKAPHIYLVEGLRVHEDEIKYVPPAEEIKESVVKGARGKTGGVVEDALRRLAQQMLEKHEDKLVAMLKEELEEEIEDFLGLVEDGLELLADTPAENFREHVKSVLLSSPQRYAQDVVYALGRTILTAIFQPEASLTDVSFAVDDVSTGEVEVEALELPRRRRPATKTMLVDAIEEKIVPGKRVRERVSTLIRTALEDRFGAPGEEW